MPLPRCDDLPSAERAACLSRQVASVYVTIGQSQGRTLLPLPAVQLSSADRTAKDKERVHVLETAVVTWTRQIKNVLKQDPEQARLRRSISAIRGAARSLPDPTPAPSAASPRGRSSSRARTPAHSRSSPSGAPGRTISPPSRSSCRRAPPRPPPPAASSRLPACRHRPPPRHRPATPPPAARAGREDPQGGARARPHQVHLLPRLQPALQGGRSVCRGGPSNTKGVSGS
jgi:hypothetical protein